jgi:hypothetical protein
MSSRETQCVMSKHRPLANGGSVRFENHGDMHQAATVGAQRQNVFARLQEGGGKGVFVPCVAATAIGSAADAGLVAVPETAGHNAAGTTRWSLESEDVVPTAYRINMRVTLS